MTLDEIYKMMKERMRSIYENDSEIVKLTIAEFMQLHHVVCYMMQIKHIVDGV